MPSTFMPSILRFFPEFLNASAPQPVHKFRFSCIFGYREKTNRTVPGASIRHEEVIMKKALPLFLAASIAALSTLGCLSTSTTAAGSVNADRQQLMLVSEEEMVASANASYAQVIAEAKANGILNTNAATTNRVQTVAKRLIAQTGTFRADAPGWDWQVNVITDSTVNAWCMAGGKIVVYTGIIESLSLTDAQLAAVMGHEISHALREHSREQVSQQALTSVGVSVVAGLAKFGTAGNTMLAIAAEYGLTLPFSRSHETEADNIGTELMARAGYDPHEAVAVWEKMSALGTSSTPEFMSTHPSNTSRIKNLTKISEKVYPLYQEATK